MIGLLGTDSIIKEELENYEEITLVKEGSEMPKLDGLFVDWKPNNQESFIFQAAAVDHYVRNIPVVIFDRFMSMTGKEYNWLKKFNTTLFEPAINHRREFEYLPEWVRIPEDIEIEIPEELKYDISYFGYILDKVKMFEKYYESFASMYPKNKVGYFAFDKGIERRKEEQWRNSNLTAMRKPEYFSSRFHVIIDSVKNMEIGYLDSNNITSMMNGIVQILPREHKYFNCMFKPMVVDNISDLDYIVTMFGREDLRKLVIEDTLKSIKKYYPEFTVEYACDKIRRSF